jgi:hypothetical protein
MRTLAPTIGPKTHISRSDDEKGGDSEHQDPAEFAAIHASIHNHFHQDRHLTRRDNFKQNRSVSLAEWRQLAA